MRECCAYAFVDDKNKMEAVRMAKERSNGECTVFERKDRPGVWRGQAVWYNPATGKNVVKSFDVSKGTELQKKREALKRAQKWLEQVEGGLMPDADKVTIGEWIDRWLQDYVKPNVRVKSYDKYEGCLCDYVKPKFGNMLLSKIKEPDLQRFFIWLLSEGGKKKQGLSTSTVKATRRYLSMCFDQAIKSGLLIKNVVKDTKPIKLVTKEIKPLNKEQAAALTHITKETGEMQHMAILLALSTGMRLGELFGLKWECVDINSGMIHVKQALVTSKAGQLFQEPKTASSRRKIPLPSDVTKELKKYKKWQDWQRHLMGDKWEDNDMVLANSFGRVIDTSNFTTRYYKKMLVAAGLDRSIKFHDLRHTHATLLLLQGVNVKVVSERLGHTSIKMTLDTYSHVLPDMQEAAVKALEGMFHIG